jgi:hypothetical protein
VLRAVPGGVDRADGDRPSGDLVAVVELVVRVAGLGGCVNRDGHAVLQSQPAVTGDVVGMRMGLQHANDPDPLVRGGREVRLGRVRGVDQDGLARLLVADEVGGTPEVLVDELAEKHRPLTLSARFAVFPKVTSAS